MRLVTSILFLFLLSSNRYLVQVTTGLTEERSEENDPLVQVTTGLTEERSGEKNGLLDPKARTEIGLSYEIEEEIENQVNEALSDHFNESFSGLSNPELFVRYLGKTYGEKGIKKLKGNLRKGKGSKVECIAFGTILELGKRLLRKDYDLIKVIELVCKVFRIERSDVCEGIANSFGPHLYHIFTRSKISGLEQVSLLLGIDSCLDVKRFKSSHLNWLVQVPPPTTISKGQNSKGGSSGKEPSLRRQSSRLDHQTQSSRLDHQTLPRYDDDETNDVIHSSDLKTDSSDWKIHSSDLKTDSSDWKIDWSDWEEEKVSTLLPHSTKDYNHQRKKGIKKEMKDPWRRRWSGNHGARGRNDEDQGRRDLNHKRGKGRKSRRQEERKIRFLQLTDVHLDLLYKQGSPINCGAPLCCRSDGINLINSSISSNTRHGFPSGSSHEEIPAMEDTISHTRTGSRNRKVPGKNHEEGRRGALDLMKRTQGTNLVPEEVREEEQGEGNEGERGEELLVGREEIEGEREEIEKEEGAGTWGELEGFCDSPLQTALSILEHINERFSRHCDFHDLNPAAGSGMKGRKKTPCTRMKRENMSGSRHSHHDHKLEGRERKENHHETNEGGNEMSPSTIDGIDDSSIIQTGRTGRWMNSQDTLNSHDPRVNGGMNDKHDGWMNRPSDRQIKNGERFNKHRHNFDSNDTLDYILWTGDITPHDVWNSNMEDLIRVVRTWSQAMKSYLPKGIPVFPVLGNHDTIPVNQFAPPDVTGPLSIDWIYKLYGSNWESWLGSNALSTFLTRGYYSKTLVISGKKIMKIIVINTNYCSRENFWQLYDPIDPGNQLQWLVNELFQAEKNRQIVHIVGHAPITSDACTQTWAHNYLMIIDRFRSIIKTSFFGHTHRDELRLYYPSRYSFQMYQSQGEEIQEKVEGEGKEKQIAREENEENVPSSSSDIHFHTNEFTSSNREEEEKENEKKEEKKDVKKMKSEGEVDPILVGFVGGSITTFGYVNPCYKVYEMNDEGIILDQETYFLNVTEANERTRQDESYKPSWKYLYTATKVFNIDNLSTESVIKLNNQFNTNDSMVEKYFSIMTRYSSSSIWNKCNQICRKNFVDMIRVTDSLHDYFKP